jgi:hypothetical protein
MTISINFILGIRERKILFRQVRREEMKNYAKKTSTESSPVDLKFIENSEKKEKKLRKLINEIFFTKARKLRVEGRKKLLFHAITFPSMILTRNINLKLSSRSFFPLLCKDEDRRRAL